MSEPKEPPAPPPDPEQNRFMAKGRGHFVGFWGVIVWGFPTAVLFSIIMAWWEELPFWPLLWLSLILFPIGGYFWGTIMWRYMEKQAERNKQ